MVITTNKIQLSWTPTFLHDLQMIMYLSIGVFPKWKKEFIEFIEFRNQINDSSMNWSQFKDPFPHVCLAGTVVAYQSLNTRGGRFKPFSWNDKYFSHRIR